MVAERSKYFIKSKGSERGPYTLSQLSRMWVSGNITADTYYRLGNIEDWTPIESLAETLEALTPVAKETEEALPVTASIEEISTPEKTTGTEDLTKIHWSIVEGNGTKGSPFVIKALSSFGAAQNQREIVDRMFGAGTYGSQTVRTWHESSRGKPNNGDLCETTLNKNGQLITVWFDLYLVTKMAEDPERQRQIEERQNSPAGEKAQKHIAEILGPQLAQVRESTVKFHQKNPPSLDTPEGRLKFAQFALSAFGGVEGSAPPVLLSDADCSKLFERFRGKWIAIHLGFWLLAGFAGLGGLAILGVIPSVVIFTFQQRWKSRQLFRAQGLSEIEIEQRLEAR